MSWAVGNMTQIDTMTTDEIIDEELPWIDLMRKQIEKYESGAYIHRVRPLKNVQTGSNLSYLLRHASIATINLMTTKNMSRQDPNDNGNPAVHTNSPLLQKKNMFLSHCTQLLLKLMPNVIQVVANMKAQTNMNCM